MYIGGPNNQFRLTEATGMDANGCDVLNDCNFAPMLGKGGIVGSHRGQNDDLEIL